MNALRLNISLNEMAAEALEYLRQSEKKSKSEIIANALIMSKEIHEKEAKKAQWLKAFEMAQDDEDYQFELKQIQDAGVNDGLY